MKKTTLLLTIAASAVLAGCSSTTVVKDISGPKVVDVMYAKFAQEVTTALNRLADVEDMNKVNVINDYNANKEPLNQSYSGTVSRQNKIVIPDTYPQTQWRNDGVNASVASTAHQAVNQTTAAVQQPLPPQQSAPVQPKVTQQFAPKNTSLVNQAIAQNKSKVHAAVSKVPPVKFQCPEGAEVKRNGPTTICITTTKVTQ